MAYRLSQGGGVIRIEDGAVIPPDAANRDYAAYLEWVAAGNEAAPYVAPLPPVPQEISDRQFFQQLAVMGLITEDEAIAAVAAGTLPAAMAAFIDQLPAEQQFAARMALQGATTFQRSNALVETFGAMQGMTSAEIDDLWRAASAL